MFATYLYCRRDHGVSVARALVTTARIHWSAAAAGFALGWIVALWLAARSLQP